jgi:hypothetical protein
VSFYTISSWNYGRGMWRFGSRVGFYSHCISEICFVELFLAFFVQHVQLWHWTLIHGTVIVQLILSVWTFSLWGNSCRSFHYSLTDERQLHLLFFWIMYSCELTEHIIKATNALVQISASIVLQFFEDRWHVNQSKVAGSRLAEERWPLFSW